jgi:hypothetical protein
MKIPLLSGLIVLSSAAAYGQYVTINIDAELLNNQSGQAMPVTGLAFLAVDTQGNGFSAPSPEAFFSASDDQIIAKWNLSAWNTAGVLDASTGQQLLAGNWNSGDALKLYWYPSLTISATAPGALGVQYGSYSGTAGVNGSEAWTTPDAGLLRTLKFFTSDATLLGMGGAEPATAGNASFTVVPEPMAIGSVAAGLCLLVGILRGASVVRRCSSHH